MKRIIIPLALTISTIAFAQPQFPADADWQLRIQERPVCLGPTWFENGELRILVGTENYALIVGNGSIVWQSPDLGGVVSALTRLDFGVGDGMEIIAAVADNNVGKLVELKGENYEDRTEFTLFGFDSVLVGHGFDDWYDYFDYRFISLIERLPSDCPDSSRSLVLFNTILITNNYPESFHKLNGRLLRYSLTEEDTASVTPCGFVAKATVCDWDSDGQREIIFQIDESEDYGPYGGAFNPRMVRSLGLLYNDMRLTKRVLHINYQSDIYAKCWSVLDDNDPQNLSMLAVYPVDDVNRDTSYVNLTRFTGPGLRPAMTVPYSPWPNMADLILCGDIERGRYLISIGNRFYVSEAGDIGNFTEFSSPLGDRTTLVDVKGGDFDNDGRGEFFLLTDNSLYIYSIGSLSVTPPLSLIPSPLSLSSFPNPFNSSTTISYSLPRPGRYALSVVDLTGREVARLSEGWKEAGNYRQVWNGNRLTSGQYVIRLNSHTESFSRPVTIIK